MKTIRVVFETDCTVNGKTYQEAYNNFLQLSLFGNNSKAEWVNLICIEDAETNKDITSEINKY